MQSLVKIIGLSVLTGIAWGLTPAAKEPASVTAHGAIADSAYSYLALGDSYTIGESVPVADRYPVQAARLLRDAHLNCMDPEIIATSGWTTADLLDGISDKTMPIKTTPVLRYAIVTLLIGVNNQFQGRSQAEYKKEFTTLVQQSIRLAGNRPSHVIVLSIPDYSVTPFARGSNTTLIASRIDAFNAINFEVSMEYKVNYLDITGESRKAATDPSLIASDGLHFSGKEYGVWADKMEPIMKAMLK